MALRYIYFAFRIDSISWQLEEAKNESIKKEKTVSKKFFKLSDQVESMAKNITKELSALREESRGMNEAASSICEEYAPSTGMFAPFFNMSIYQSLSTSNDSVERTGDKILHISFKVS